MSNYGKVARHIDEAMLYLSHAEKLLDDDDDLYEPLRRAMREVGDVRRWCNLRNCKGAKDDGSRAV